MQRQSEPTRSLRGGRPQDDRRSWWKPAASAVGEVVAAAVVCCLLLAYGAGAFVASAAERGSTSKHVVATSGAGGPALVAPDRGSVDRSARD